ncbi:MAG: hypothetical protein A2049_04535 [Elusimicrobia bacterium GWA2_62_23]|nr:MAG: hypothetical protein A2049_04535 [Elusimicrobia bacterium GWA2_62_23]OGR71792.1 MAG: hypothetical protein A2179_04945 [Elusimicrobia bacterium GWC2_63_65]
MSFGPSGGTPRKDSIFSSIAPAQPAPAPAPAAAPRPAMDAEGLAALKQKIDVMEKNIVAQLEKKLSDQAKAPAGAPPPPAPAAPPVPDMFFRKMEDLERRLADFGQAAAVSASQLRNIEESKISARREIEDLLKAVRDQQKYSEMDRQMHDQLEKAWTRAEELEKKLMDFYSSVIAMEAKRRDDAAASSDKSVAALEALTARLAALEQRLAASPIEQLAGDMRRAQEEFMARAARESSAMLAAQEAAARDTLAGFRDASASLRDFFDNNFRRELNGLSERVAGETAALRRELAASLQESRDLLREQGAAAAARTDEFGKVLEASRLKSEAAEAALEVSARRQALALEEFARRLDADLRAVSSEYLAAAKKENDERFARFGAKYADALLSVTFVENFRAAITASIDRLQAHEARMTEFLSHVSPVQLERLMGVSGEVVREQFEAMGNATGELKEDLARLRDIKRGIEQKVRDIFGES